MGRAELTRTGAPALAGLAIVAFPLVVKDPFWQNVAVLILVFATAATAWTLLGGFAGQLSFGHSLFFGVGAYTTALFVIGGGWSPWLGMGAAAAIAVAIGTAVGFPVFRLRSHYFSIATLAMQQVAFTVVINTPALGESAGLPLPLRPASLANLQFSIRDKTEYHLVAFGLYLAAVSAVWWVLRGPIGYYVRATRDDEDAARALGVRVRRYKLYAMAISAAFTAVAGSFYAMYALFVDPNTVVTVGFSILIALAAILGGATSLWGPLVGTAILILLQQGTRVLYSGAATGIDFVIYGALVVMIALVEPRGIAGVVDRIRGRSPA